MMIARLIPLDCSWVQLAIAGGVVRKTHFGDVGGLAAWPAARATDCSMETIADLAAAGGALAWWSDWLPSAGSQQAGLRLPPLRSSARSPPMAATTDSVRALWHLEPFLFDVFRLCNGIPQLYL